MISPEDLLFGQHFFIPHATSLGRVSKMLAETVSGMEQRTRTGLVCMDDNTLVEAAKRGDRNAFGFLFERHQQKIMSRAFRVTGNYQDSEDVVQQSFHNAFVHLKEFQGRSSFSTWLTRIALNEALMLRRKWWKGREVSIDEPAQKEEASLVVEIPDPGPNPEGYSSRQECQRLLFAAIDELRPGLRAAVQICDLHERSLAETAQVLGLSVVAVKSRLNRARRMLREKLNRDVKPTAPVH
jgi:RNA polymerase sigma factor (sigma-70 family)